MMNNYIKSGLTKEEIAEIVSLSMDDIYISQINPINVEKDKPKVKRLVQKHSDR